MNKTSFSYSFAELLQPTFGSAPFPPSLRSLSFPQSPLPLLLSFPPFSLSFPPSPPFLPSLLSLLPSLPSPSLLSLSSFPSLPSLSPSLPPFALYPSPSLLSLSSFPSLPSLSPSLPLLLSFLPFSLSFLPSLLSPSSLLFLSPSLQSPLPLPNIHVYYEFAKTHPQIVCCMFIEPLTNVIFVSTLYNKCTYYVVPTVPKRTMKAELHNLFKAAIQHPSQKILKMVNRGRLIVILQLYDIGISMETIQ